MEATRELGATALVPPGDAAAFAEALRAAIGYRVVAPEGKAGVITGVPENGRPPRPLLLVVRDGNTFRFVPLRRIERVVPREREVVVGGEMGPPPGGGGSGGAARSASSDVATKGSES